MSWREWIGLKPTKSDFIQRLLSFSSRHGERGWQYDATNSTLKHVGHEGAVNCGNIYLEYRHSHKNERQALLEKYTGLLKSFQLKIPELWSVAAKNIFPCVRSRHMLMTAEIDSRPSVHAFPSMLQQLCAGDLQVMLVYDHGQQVAAISEEKSAVWGQPKTQLFSRAIANLKSLPKPSWIAENEHVYKLDSAVSYQETFLLIAETLNSLPIRDNVMLMAPNRGVLLAADGNNNEAVKVLLNTAYHCLMNNPWPLSGMMYAHTSMGVVVVQPSDELKELAHSVELVSLHSTYDAQKMSLEAYYERVKQDRFVASFSVMSNKDNSNICRSWCFWGEGIASSLPHTDLVAFGRDAGSDKQQTIMVPWDQARQICGEYLQRTDDDPERFLVNAFPDESQWQKLSTLSKQAALSEL